MVDQDVPYWTSLYKLVRVHDLETRQMGSTSPSHTLPCSIESLRLIFAGSSAEPRTEMRAEEREVYDRTLHEYVRLLKFGLESDDLVVPPHGACQAAMGQQ
jgi:hypothetical protein